MHAIYPQSKCRVRLYSHATATSVFDLTEHVESFQTAKTLQGTMGSGSIEIKTPQSWPSLRYVVRDDDWLVVELESFGRVKVELFFVDLVHEDFEIVESGARVRTTTIAFSDVAKPANMHQFRLWMGTVPPWMPGLLQADDEIAAIALGSPNMSPVEVAQRLMARVFRPSSVQVNTRTERRPVGPEPQKKTPPPAVQPAVTGERLSKYHRLEEFTRGTGQTPPPAVQENLARLAGYLDALRDGVFGGAAVTIRPGGGWDASTPAFGQEGSKVGAKKARAKRKASSRHRTGEAADISVEGYEPEEVALLIRSAISAGTVPWGGLGLYKTFVHYDIGTGANRPAQWVGEDAAPTAAQLEAVGGLDAWKAWKPSASDASPQTDTAEVHEDIAQVRYEDVTVTDVTYRPGGSGEGAFVVPQSLTSAVIPGTGESQARLDWIDALDMQSWTDNPAPVRGSWWQLYSLLHQRGTVDGLARQTIDATFNEWFFDMRPVPASSSSALRSLLGGWAPCLVFRRRPFDLEAWESLNEWDAGDAWTRLRFTQGGLERGTLHYVRSPAAELSTDNYTDGVLSGGAGTIPALDLAGARIHGLRAVEADAPFVFPNIDADGRNLVEALAYENRAFYRWNAWLPVAPRVTVEFPYFHPAALVGTRIAIDDSSNGETEPLRGYISEVREVFTCNKSTGAIEAKTAVVVERCHRGALPQPEPKSWRV